MDLADDSAATADASMGDGPSGGTGETQSGEPSMPDLGSSEAGPSSSEGPIGAQGRGTALTEEEVSIIQQAPDLIRAFVESLVRRGVPYAVHSRKSADECIAAFPAYLEDGFLDGLVAHYMQLGLDIRREKVREVFSLFPVLPGEKLCAELLA
jgi:hypothetical protein